MGYFSVEIKKNKLNENMKIIKQIILEKYYDKFSGMPTSSGWYKEVEDFLSKALDEQREEMIKEIMLEITKMLENNKKGDLECEVHEAYEVGLENLYTKLHLLKIKKIKEL